MPIRIDVYHHIMFDTGALGQIEQLVKQVNTKVDLLIVKGNIMTQEVDDLKTAVTEVMTAVDQLPGVVDAFEARITTLIANSGMSQADKDAVTAATADLRSSVAKALAAVADATDGIDEGAPTPP